MKQKASKLDGHAERLREWLNSKDQGGQGMTYDQAVEQLRLDGVSVSRSRLAEWWVAEQSRLMQERLLGQIASGARQCKEVEAELAKNPAPEMDTLIKLHRVLILNLSTKGNADPEYLELVNRMMREVRQFIRTQQLGQQIALERDKFEFDAASACLKKLPELKAVAADKGLSDSEKIEQFRLKLFGVAPGNQS